MSRDGLLAPPFSVNSVPGLSWAPVVCTLCLAGFLWEGTIGFNLADEGFLWYGAQRVMQGEVPIRDFMAYDVGRYYWAAMIMWLRGDSGLVSLWMSVAIFQAVGLSLALSIVLRSVGRTSPVWLIVVASTLLLWMIPRHKTFDITTSIFLVAVLAWLIETPNKARHFLAGVAVGLAAIIGRNHGSYGLLGYLGAITLLCPGDRQIFSLLTRITLWLMGIAVGFLPVGLLAIFSPEFAAAFWESIRFLLGLMADSRNTNLPLPVPWPWLADFDSSHWPTTVRTVLLGLLFIGVVLFGVLGIASVIYRRKRNLRQSPLLMASAFMALPYAHHAFSRAEILHLAQGSFPLFLGLLAWTCSKGAVTRWMGTMGLFVISLLVALPAHLGYQRMNEGNWTEARLGKDAIKVSQNTANNIQVLQNLIDYYAPPGKAFLAVPYWPGAYAIAHQKSPMWEIYALYPSSRNAEEHEIARIVSARPQFVVIQDVPLDGREDLKFSNTHPLIHQHVVANFKKATSPFSDATLDLYLSPQSLP